MVVLVSVLSGPTCTSGSNSSYWLLLSCNCILHPLWELYLTSSVSVGKSGRVYWHFCADNIQDKMSIELIWNFTGLEASLASVDFPNSPAIFLNIWDEDIVEKGQQEWKTQGCKDPETDEVLPLDTLALEARLPCLGFSTAVPFFPCIQPWAHRRAKVTDSSSLLSFLSESKGIKTQSAVTVHLKWSLMGVREWTNPVMFNNLGQNCLL